MPVIVQPKEYIIHKKFIDEVVLPRVAPELLEEEKEEEETEEE